MTMLPPNTVATIRGEVRPNRVQEDQMSLGPASVRTPIISENSTSATSARIKRFLEG